MLSRAKELQMQASDLIAQIGAKLGITVNLEPQYRRVGQLITPSGAKFYFRGTNLDLNGQGAAEIARDKDYASYFMRQMGYPTPTGRTFLSDAWCQTIGSDQNIDAAYQYARTLGFPVIVKPNSKGQGIGVAKVFNKREFYRAMRVVFNTAQDRVALVQKVVAGDDYRIVVLDELVISAYKRSPLSILGDGKSTIYDLLMDKQAQFKASGRSTILHLDDYRIGLHLNRHGRSWKSIPAEGEVVTLLDNANLSMGGTATDVTDSLHSEYKSLTVRLTHDMGLRYCGIDILTRDPINMPPAEYTIVEVNAAPGLDHYAEVGEVQRKIVESLYEQILHAFLLS